LIRAKPGYLTTLTYIRKIGLFRERWREYDIRRHWSCPESPPIFLGTGPCNDKDV